MHVFRAGVRAASGPSLRRELAQQLERAARTSSPDVRDRATAALLRAGELECALEDEHARSAVAAAEITDRAAEVLIGARAPSELERGVALAASLDVPSRVSVSPPESFVYYALHPLDFADLARDLDVPAGRAVVVGLRTIGTTLSAVVAAALRKRGVDAQRFTVRPEGHPYDRRLVLDPQHIRRVAAAAAHDALFVIVDEGPALSGSSFLAVAEAIEGAGVAATRIVLLGTRRPDPGRLLAPDAARRFARFRLLVTRPSSQVPPGARRFVPPGTWRAACGDEASWPASWTELERLKLMSDDGRTLFKFEGLGRDGDAAFERARVLHEAGFSPAAHEAGAGFVAYEVLAGAPARAGDSTPEVVDTLARYVAFRRAVFAAEGDPSDLASMVRFDYALEFGREPPPFELTLERGVVTDARMMPCEWIRTPSGQLAKVDAASHGDDHLFPGPTDGAWDLAGAIVEWGLGPRDEARLLDVYRRASGDDPRRAPPGVPLRVRGASHGLREDGGRGDERARRRRALPARVRALSRARAPRVARPLAGGIASRRASR